MKTNLASKNRRQRQKNLAEATRDRAASIRRRSYTATEAKNEFGRVLDEALQGETIVITKHDSPKAVLISIDKFNALEQAPQLKLNALTLEFDSLLLQMQTDKARAGMARAFKASPEQLGKAAVAAARKRG